MIGRALTGEVPMSDALDYCFVRYRTCRALARWTAAKLLGVEVREIDASSGDAFIRSIESVVYEKMREELADEPTSMQRMRLQAEVTRILALVIRVLASNYEEEVE